MLSRSLGLILNVFITPGKNGQEDIALSMVGAQKDSMVELSSAASSYRSQKKEARGAAYYLGDTLAVSIFARAVLPADHPARKVLDASIAQSRAELTKGEVGPALISASEGVGHALEATQAGKNAMERMFYLNFEDMK